MTLSGHYPSLGSFFHLEGRGQDWLYNLQGLVHNENVGLLLKNYYEFQDGGGRALNQEWGLSKDGVLCDCISHLPRKPALAMGWDGAVSNAPSSSSVR